MVAPPSSRSCRLREDRPRAYDLGRGWASTKVLYRNRSSSSTVRVLPADRARPLHPRGGAGPVRVTPERGCGQHRLRHHRALTGEGIARADQMAYPRIVGRWPLRGPSASARQRPPRDRGDDPDRRRPDRGCEVLLHRGGPERQRVRAGVCQAGAAVADRDGLDQRGCHLRVEPARHRDHRPHRGDRPRPGHPRDTDGGADDLRPAALPLPDDEPGADLPGHRHGRRGQPHR